MGGGGWIDLPEILTSKKIIMVIVMSNFAKRVGGGALSTLPGSDAYDELFVTFFVQVCIKWPCSGSDITSDWRALSICDFEDQGNWSSVFCLLHMHGWV